MIDSAALLKSLKAQVLALEDDLRTRVAEQPDVDADWRAEHARLVAAERTAHAWPAWRDDRVTQAAVAWVLTSVFIRFAEDNRLLRPVWIAGPPERRQEALDAQLAYFRQHPDDSDRDWLEQAVDHLHRTPVTRDLVEEHSPLRAVSPSGAAAGRLLTFWRERDESGKLLLWDFFDVSLSTRFLGDLYQDLSEHAKKTFALLQTPEFVEEFILDQTLEPALAERPLEGFRLIDPTCGSGHFLLGAFRRLLVRWDRAAPAMELQARAQLALDAIHGVDLNPYAVAIARFRLTIAALQACGLTSLEGAPAFNYHLAAGDSLLFGRPQQALPVDGFDHDRRLTAIAQSSEDVELLNAILDQGRYDVVVGNPPYVTVKDKALNDWYRRDYPTCKGTYALTVPFMERFFQLAKPGRDDRPAGWVGQITSNSFMKREFGSKLIEQFLVNQDLRLVADTSGAYIPGHGTPTVIITGRNQRAIGETIRAVLGVRGESGRPDHSDKGLVWRSIVEHVDKPGHNDEWVSVANLARNRLAKHPWSLSGGGALTLLSELALNGAQALTASVDSIGFMSVTREDDAYVVGSGMMRRLRVDRQFCRPLAGGSDVRDWQIQPRVSAIVPYDTDGDAAADVPILRHLWRYRQLLIRRRALSGTQLEQGLEWYEYSQLNRARYAADRLISFAFVATHNQFGLSKGLTVFIRTAPVIKLPEGATEEDHLGLLGVLNSSTACFWLKQNSHGKGNGGVNEGFRGDDWEEFFEFTGTTLQEYPLPANLPVDRARWLDDVARQLAESAPRHVVVTVLPTAAHLLEAHENYLLNQATMIAEQEELDWEVYGLYNLPGGDLVYSGGDLPPLQLGERAFEIALARKVAAGEETTAWFARHGSTPITEIPAHWPEAYRDLVQRRLDLIESDPNIRLLEKPEHKRRWASEPWEKQQEAALRGWLLDRLEQEQYWFTYGRPTPRSIAQLADLVARDADLVSVIALWEGRPDVPIATSLTKLMTDEAVPFLAAYRLKDTGLRKYEAWLQTWDLQRREDAGEDVGTIPVPPKYTNADFRRPSWWQARGKLDVPKERFILYPDAGRSTDPTLLLGWAGWDHAQQALALASILQDREAEGWETEPMVPLVAGLAELQPWVEQWHADLDPRYGTSMADFCRQQLAERTRQVDRSIEQLAAWRPAPATRGRRTQAPSI